MSKILHLRKEVQKISASIASYQASSFFIKKVSNSPLINFGKKYLSRAQKQVIRSASATWGLQLTFLESGKNIVKDCFKRCTFGDI